MKRRRPGAPKRKTYRHGDLRRALLEAGVALARGGGPEAVVLREATRRAGVVPNAAYRHFAGRDALLQAVRNAAFAELAAAMEKELAAIPVSAPAADQARACLRAVGTGYLRFALDQPGLFRTAFGPPIEGQPATDAARAGPGGLTPFQLLSQALDRMVAAGVLPPERRAGAEYLAWPAIHGLATIVIDGPLRRFTRDQAEQVGQKLLDMVEKGL
jgi:AcrR family transcriptional regulator